MWCLMHLHRFSPERLVPHRSVAMMSLVESNAAFVGHASPIYAVQVEYPADIGWFRLLERHLPKAVVRGLPCHCQRCRRQ